MSKRPLAVVLLAVACAPSVTFVPTNASPRALAPRPVAEVAVYSDVLPEKPVVEVGIVSATTHVRGMNGAVITDPPEFIQVLREEAARQGCDAIIVRPSGVASYQGTCLVYK